METPSLTPSLVTKRQATVEIIPQKKELPSPEVLRHHRLTALKLPWEGRSKHFQLRPNTVTQKRSRSRQPTASETTSSMPCPMQHRQGLPPLASAPPRCQMRCITLTCGRFTVQVL